MGRWEVVAGARPNPTEPEFDPWYSRPSMPPDLFADSDVIHSYSRAQAIADGALVDLTPLAREAGFRFPVAITSAAHAACVSLTPAAEESGCDAIGRAWDLLTCLRLAVKMLPRQADRVEFECWCVQGRARPEPVRLWALVGPGDDLAPVITVMVEGED